MKQEMQKTAKEMGFGIGGYNGATKTQYLTPVKGCPNAWSKHWLAFLSNNYPDFKFILI